MSGSGTSLPQLAEYQNRPQEAGGETRVVLAATLGAEGQVVALGTQQMLRTGIALNVHTADGSERAVAFRAATYVELITFFADHMGVNAYA